MKSKVYRALALAIGAYITCVNKGNTEWEAKHLEYLNSIAKNFLPHGSGFDSGSKIDTRASTGEKIIITTSYHHMDDNGAYDGWTDHTITVRPSLMLDFSLTISGRDRNGFKEYAYELFQSCLSEDIDS
jgi:hypothetical protein